MKHTVFIAPGRTIRLAGGQTLTSGMNRGVSDAALAQLRRGHSGNFCAISEGPDSAYDAALPPRFDDRAKQAITRAALQILSKGRAQTAAPPLDVERVFGTLPKSSGSTAPTQSSRDPIGEFSDVVRHAASKAATRPAVFDVSKVFRRL